MQQKLNTRKCEILKLVKQLTAHSEAKSLQDEIIRSEYRLSLPWTTKLGLLNCFRGNFRDILGNYYCGGNGGCTASFEKALVFPSKPLFITYKVACTKSILDFSSSRSVGPEGSFSNCLHLLTSLF